MKITISRGVLNDNRIDPIHTIVETIESPGNLVTSERGKELWQIYRYNVHDYLRFTVTVVARLPPRGM